MAIAADAYSKKEFNRLRKRITIACTSIVVFVFAIVLIIVTLAEYNSKMDYLEQQVGDAIERLVKDKDVDELASSVSIAQAANAQSGSYIGNITGTSSDGEQSQSQGDGADGDENAGTSSDDVPIAIYKVDSSGNKTVPLDAATASLKGTALDQASTLLIDSDDGFYRFRGGSPLAALKVQEQGSEIIAVTDASALDQYLADFVRTFVSLVLLIVALAAGMFYNMSNWFIEPVREMWRKQQNFIADASHELKTPVSVIMANSDIIAGEAKEAEVASRASIIFEESEKMTQLIADMMYLLTDKAKDAEKDVFDLSRALERCTMAFAARAWERKVLFDDSQVEGGVQAMCDPDGVTRVISILLDNACKYAEEGTTCTVSLESEKRIARMSVTNKGEDIPPDELDSLFERFFRTDSSRTRSKETSYGLGLAMARDIVEANGGRISAASEDGEITFTVELPLADQKDLDAKAERERKAEEELALEQAEEEQEADPGAEQETEPVTGQGIEPKPEAEPKAEAGKETGAEGREMDMEALDAAVDAPVDAVPATVAASDATRECSDDEILLSIGGESPVTIELQEAEDERE